MTLICKVLSIQVYNSLVHRKIYKVVRNLAIRGTIFMVLTASMIVASNLTARFVKEAIRNALLTGLWKGIMTELVINDGK